MSSDAQEVPRVVLLGASNLRRGLASAVLAARQRLDVDRIEVLAALGHGRSYGLSSRVLWRTLPSILDCGLWPALAAGPARPTWALITDVGNDLGYGARPEVIAGWVEECLRRLSPTTERVVLGGLPLSKLQSLGAFRFDLVRRILFPSSDLTHEQAIDRALELDQRLAHLARIWNAARIEPDVSWYGIDPLHVKIGRRAEAWAELVAPWAEERRPPAAAADLGDRYLAWRSRAAVRTHFGRLLETRQPCTILSCGSSIALY